MMDNQRHLPLFPVKIVLFPGMPLALHIADEGHKLMVRESIGRGKPFGVVLTPYGCRSEGTAAPHRIGTSAIIVDVTELPDGELDIVAVGYQRFRILSLLHDQPYLSGLVKVLPPRGEEMDAAYRQAACVRLHLKRYLRLFGELTEDRIELAEMPTKPVLLAFLAAVLLQVPPADKQRLLASETIPEMLAREKALLLREWRFLQADIGVEYALEEGGLSFSNS